MNFDSCDFILSYIELRVTAPLTDINCKVPVVDVTLTSDAMMGETLVFVNFLTESFPKNTIFTNGDFSFTLARDHSADETELDVYPLIDDLKIGDVFESIMTYHVFSINSLENTVDSQELTDRVFGKSLWTTNRITNRVYNIVVSGIKISDDFGLSLIRKSTLLNKPVYFDMWVEDNPVLPVNGIAFVKKLTENVLVDNNIEVSFELVVSKVGLVDKILIYTIGSEELDAIIGEGLEETYFLLSQ